MKTKAYFSLRSAILALPAAVYYAVQKTREKAYLHGLLTPERVEIPVISVGNILLGGAGKTPFVIYAAQMISDRGLKPAVISRGYKGTYRSPFLVVGDGVADTPQCKPQACGDEPYLISERLPHVPVIVGRKRIDALRVAQDSLGCNVAILDDGFQHLQLERDVDIVILNGSEDWMFPLGRLREPISALERAEIVILMGSDTKLPPRAEQLISGAQVVRCRLEPDAIITSAGSSSSLSLEDYVGKEIFLASGIANPERFRKTAAELGWVVADHLAFADHHRFSDSELKDILERAGSDPVVVTEKDWVKLPDWFKGSGQTCALRISVVPDNEPALWNAIRPLIRQRLNGSLK
jgi:tetraacyldisaccharide 4'-kinase